MKRILIFGASAILLLSFTSCGTSPQEYDDLKAELEQAKADIAALQAQVAEAEQSISDQQETISTYADNIERLFDQRNQAWDELDRLQRVAAYAAASQAPFPGNIYVDPNSSISVKKGESFLIKYDLGNGLFITSINKSYDDAFISAEGQQAFSSPSSDFHAGVWFFFRAISPGSTKITVSRTIGELGERIVDPVTFEVLIT